MAHPRARPYRVLVVDDEPSVREVFCAMLARGGYTVDAVSDGRAALTQMSQAGYDVVITDLVMPEQEGIETIQILRKQFPAAKIIAISGAFGGEFLTIARLLGAHATLEKPVKYEALIAAVENSLQS